MWLITKVVLLCWALGALLLVCARAFWSIRRFVDRGDHDLPQWLHHLPLEQLRVRRWAFPTDGTAIAQVQGHLKVIIQSLSSKGKKDASANMGIVNDPKALSKASIIIAFEKSGGMPVAAHVLLKSDITRELVLVNCLLVVNPKIPKADQISRRLVWCNTLLSIHFTLFSFRDSVTLILISRSPRHIAGFSDTVCRGYIYPYYRHNPQHSEPEEWQREIANSVVIDLGYYLGLTPDARLDSKTFVVKAAFPPGHPTLSSEECLEECQRLNEYCREFLKHDTDAFMLISRLHTFDALFSYWAQRRKMLVKVLGGLVMAQIVIIAICHSLVCRWDGMYRSWEKVERFCRIRVVQIGNGLRHASKSGSKPCKIEPPNKGILYVSNHFSWMDFPYTQQVSNLKLRTIIRADLSRLGVFGSLASYCASNVGTILYKRGDKNSGDTVRKEIVSILKNDKMPVLVFPEGTSTINGPVASFKSGSFESAMEASAPIQPLTIWYSEPIGMNRTTDDLYQSTIMLERPLQVILKAHEPLYPSDFSSGESMAKECHRIISEEYERLSSIQAP